MKKNVKIISLTLLIFVSVMSGIMLERFRPEETAIEFNSDKLLSSLHKISPDGEYASWKIEGTYGFSEKGRGWTYSAYINPSTELFGAKSWRLEAKNLIELELKVLKLINMLEIAK